MASRHELLGAADSAWWHMEAETNQMVITAVMTFDRPLDVDRLRHVLQTKLLGFERFRQRVVEPRWGVAQPRWEDDPAFSLDHHFDLIELAPPAGRRELQELVSLLMSQQLDYRHPPWEFHYVTNYTPGSALVARLHHCIADGLALIQVLLALDDTPGNEWVPTWNGQLPAHLRAEAERTGIARAAPGKLLSLVRSGALGVAKAGELALRSFDPTTVLHGRLGREKRAAWSDAFHLEEIKQAGRHAGATVNEVLASVVAGGLRGYLERRGHKPDGLFLRAVLPVNLRETTDVRSLGNKFGLMFLPLPVGLPDPLDRLRAMREISERMKRSCEALVVYRLLQIFGRATRPVLAPVVELLGKKASLVLTNVPGPRETVWFCGAQLCTLMAWVPQSGKLGLGISALSYDGKVQIGVATDAGLVPDPEAIVAATHDSLGALYERVRRTPAMR